MRILILSCNTGQGHNVAANALYEQFTKRHIPCVVKDTLAFSSKFTSKAISNTYVSMAKSAPDLFHFIYKNCDKLKSEKIKSFSYICNQHYSIALAKYINDNAFDAVISCHLFPAEVITHLKKRNKINVKAFFVATDYTCYPLIDELVMDGYFVPHKDIIESYVEQKAPREKVYGLGIPVSEKFSLQLDKKELRQKYKIDDNQDAILLMSGSMGFGNITKILKKIVSSYPVQREYKVFVLCGRNKRLKAKINELFGDRSNIVCVPFTTDVHEYMVACDVLLTKPGGLSTYEAGARNILLVHTQPIPGCETDNVSFYLEKGMSVYSEEVSGVVHKTISLLSDKDKQEKMIEAQKENVNPFSARDVCSTVLSIIKND